MTYYDKLFLIFIAVLAIWNLILTVKHVNTQYDIEHRSNNLTRKIDSVEQMITYELRKHLEIYTEDGHRKVWMKEVVEALLKKLKMEVGYTCIHPKVELISIKSKPVKRTRRGRTNG